MIIDRLENAARYTALHPLFARAFAVLRDMDTRDLPAGRHGVDGEKLYLSVVMEPGRGYRGARLEAHRRYIDIQFQVSGIDEMGWKVTKECLEFDGGYHAERDLQFFTDEPEIWFSLLPGTFAIFFPEDAHAPLAGEGDMHKIVVKVAVE